MAKSYEFRVVFNPTRHIQEDGYVLTETQIDFGNRFGTHRITSTVSDLRANVGILAESVRNGQGVSASVYLVDRNARKPSGFDAARRKLEFGVRTFDPAGNEILSDEQWRERARFYLR